MVCFNSPLLLVPEVGVDVLVCFKFKGDLLYCAYKYYHIIFVLNAMKYEYAS